MEIRQVKTSSDRDVIYVNSSRLSPELKAVISHWIDYYVGKLEDHVFFRINNQKISVAHNEGDFYTIYYRWLVIDVADSEMFETLDLLEVMLRGMN